MITSIVTSARGMVTTTIRTRTESLYAIARSAYLTRTGAMKNDVPFWRNDGNCDRLYYK